MKLKTVVVIAFFAAGSVLARNIAAAENVPCSRDGQAIASRQQTDRPVQIASVVPEERAIAVRASRAARITFADEPDLYSESDHPGDADGGIIEAWRGRVFKALGMHARPRRSDPMRDNRMHSNTEMDEQANEGRIITRIIVKETLRYAQERLPEIEELIKAMRFEVSTDMIVRQNSETAAAPPQARTAHAIHHAPAEDRFFLKTGLRIPVDGGKPAVVSETEATYGKLSSFFKVRLDGRYDSTAGLTYVLGRDLRVQVEQQVTHETVVAANDRAETKESLGLVQLVCTF
jgi:hypothetical protein